jgi:hypothetical protein
VLDGTKRLGENVCRLRCRGNVTNVDVARIVNMTDIMITSINVFAASVIDVVLDVL